MSKQINLCTNIECKKCYFCKNYRTKSFIDYSTTPNLKSKCNEKNGYKLYVHWNSKGE